MWFFLGSILENRHISSPFQNDELYGKIPPNCWTRDYLLFKQIAGPVWPRLQRPLNLAPLQMFKSPSEGIGVLLRNKQLLGQNSLWIPGWTASSDAEPFR